MKLRAITAVAALVLIAAACTSNNPVGFQAPEDGPVKDAAPFMGSGH